MGTETKASERIAGGDINKVLLLVTALQPDSGDAQLTLLLHSFAIACRTCGVSCETAMAQFERSFAVVKNVDLVALRNTDHA